MRTQIGAIVAVALGAGLIAAPASATTVYVLPDNRFGDIYVVEGDNGANDIRLKEEQRNRYLISDRRSRIHDPDDLCNELSPRRVRCGIPSIDDVFGNGGSDRLKIAGRERDIFQLAGGGGSDIVIGGLSRDRLYGGSGADVMRGRRGKDRLGPRLDSGLEPGKDVFAGGTGVDYIGARDNRADRVINCGPGNRETAKIDRRKDPDPVGCEHVRRGS